MPFGYSKELFPYPAVEYIPLNFYNLGFVKNWTPPWQGDKQDAKFELYVFSDLEPGQELIDNYQIPTPEINKLEKNEILLITLNSQVTDIKYRAYKVIMIGSITEKTVHIFKIKADYFYKQELYFTLYDSTEQKLARKNFTLPSKLF